MRCFMYVGNIYQYNEEKESLPKGFKKWIKFLKSTDFSKLASGSYELEKGSYFNLDVAMTEPIEKRKWESHRKHVDIQFVLTGREMIGYQPISAMKALTEEYDDKDLYFYEATSEEGTVHVPMTEGTFVIFFPGDAHRPLCKVGDDVEKVKKVIMKIKL